MTDESQSVEPEEEFEEEAIIPEEDFREAIAVCRKDPELNRYFKMAPPGAKLFIGLGFYSTHFGDKVDPRQYAECQAEIEPSLTVNDLKYLIRFERDKNTKKYLRELLAQREAEAAPEDVSPPEPTDEPIVPPKRKRRRKVSAPNLQTDVHTGGKEGAFPPALKVAAIFVLLLGGLFALYSSYRASVRSSASAPSVATADLTGNGKDGASNMVVRADDRSPEPGTPVEGVQMDITGPETTMTDVNEEEPPQRVETPEELTRGPAAASNATVVGSRSHGRKPHVVFTNGKKIVRRPGGVVEVPRVFSCAGAGIKPFWVYGAHPEIEAAKEKKAREEWQALVTQAEETVP